MRLFVAVELGEAVQQEAGRIVEELRRRAGKRSPRARVTWVAPERMHLTLRFIGEIADAAADGVIHALRAPLGLAPFDVDWKGLGAFPKSGPPRVLWAGIDRGCDELVAVEREVGARLDAVKIPREERPYSPHLTLARVREAAGLRSAVLFEGLADNALGTTRVDAITLFQSKLSPKGPTYVTLQKTSLRGGS
jgi:2'-5' RNA ligase